LAHRSGWAGVFSRPSIRADEDTPNTMSPRRRQPDYHIGGSFSEDPSGYRMTLQTSSPQSAPMVMQELYANASQKRYTPKWDGREPGDGWPIFWTDPFHVSCGGCGYDFGRYVAWRSGRQYGIVQHTARRYHEIGRFPPDNFKKMPYDRFEPHNRRFWLWDEVGGRSGKASAHFKCQRCGLKFEYDLRRLGKKLFDLRPDRHTLMPH